MTPGQYGDAAPSPDPDSRLVAVFSCNRLGRQANPPRPSLGDRVTR